MFNWLFKLFTKSNKHSSELLLLECQIHGSHYYDCLSLLKAEKLFVGEPVILQREPNNEYDSNAIEVLTQNKVKLGYIPKRHNTVIAALMDQHRHIRACIDDIAPTAWEPISIKVVMCLKQ